MISVRCEFVRTDYACNYAATIRNRSLKQRRYW
jgi:hypothetical protein